MKRIVRFLFIHCIVFVVILSIIFLTQLVIDAIKIDGRDPYYREIPREEWNTNLTEEEHYQNIVERTEKYIENKKISIHPNYDDISYEVYLVYSFDDNPEFFLVEFTYEPELAGEREHHLMGRISNDEYYIIRCECGEIKDSVYRKAGVIDKKLYFYFDPWGKDKIIFAYEHNGNLFAICETSRYTYDPSEIENIPDGWTGRIYGK